MSQISLRRYRAERLLAKEFTGMRSKVLSVVRSKLRARGVSLDIADLEACYAQAWQGLYAALMEGEQIDDPPAWLVTVTFRRAIDESRAGARHALTDVESRGAGFDPDIDGALEARARLAHLFEGLRTRLNERECRAASLCYLQGLSREEAAAQMGISKARMRKLMDGASPNRPGVAGKVGELLSAIVADRWCEEQTSLMRAFAYGILDSDGDRYALAVAHCRECPACRAHVASLRGLAAVLPPLPIPLAFAGGVGAGTAAVVGGGASPVAPGAGISLSSNLGGSLALKLAASGLIVLGGGYAALNGLAHGRSAHRPSSIGPPSGASLLDGVLLARPISASRAQVSTIGARASREHASSRSRPAGSAARELGPERISLSGFPQAPRATPAGRRRAGGASRELGFE